MSSVGARSPPAHSQKMMDWASWELSRSALDESVKSSTGLLLYVEMMKSADGESIRWQVPSFNLKYVSSFAFPVLYFSHLHCVMSGLFLSGFVIRNRRFLARVSEESPRWRCIQEHWCEDSTNAPRRVPHGKVFEQYDRIQSRQLNWLPQRSDKLVSLKDLRERATYRTESMGAYTERDTVADVMDVIPEHVAFQGNVLKLVCEMVAGGHWNRSYNPSRRTTPLQKRFAEYSQLAQSVSLRFS
jgi:hypothetical protein